MTGSWRHPLEAVVWSAPPPKGGADGEIVACDGLTDKVHPEVCGK